MDTLHLHIDDVAFGGKGVGRAGGQVVFVPFTITGEDVTVRVEKRKKNFAEASLLSIEKPSPHRLAPPCPYFGECGGCSYQHIAYAEQLAIKSRQVEQTLRRIGRFEHVPMQPAIGSPLSYGYRNRIRVHSVDGTTGFYAHDQRTLLDIEACPISSPLVNAELRALRQRELQDGDYTVAEQNGNYFRQTNDEAAALLVAEVAAIVREDQALLVDAYCGAGLFAKHLAPFFENVVGIEENSFAIEVARRSAWPNESYLIGEVASHLREVLSGETPERTTVVLDPPAAGINARVTETILSRPPVEIVYVSCNPATLSRDLFALGPAYRLERVTPVDMFPQTAEIEVIAHLLHHS